MDREMHEAQEEGEGGSRACRNQHPFLRVFPEGKKNEWQKLMAPAHLSSARLRSPVQLTGKFPYRMMAKPVKHPFLLRIFSRLILGAHKAYLCGGQKCPRVKAREQTSSQ